MIIQPITHNPITPYNPNVTESYKFVTISIARDRIKHYLCNTKPTDSKNERLQMRFHDQ